MPEKWFLCFLCSMAGLILTTSAIKTAADWPDILYDPGRDLEKPDKVVEPRSVPP